MDTKNVRGMIVNSSHIGNGKQKTRDDLRNSIAAARAAAAQIGSLTETAAKAAEEAIRLIDAAEVAKQAVANVTNPTAKPRARRVSRGVVVGRPSRARVEMARFAQIAQERLTPPVVVEQEHLMAYQEFLRRLQPAIDKAGDAISVIENKAWVKIESLVNGHRLYVAKGKTLVGRVESTLPPHFFRDAIRPDRDNGRIASWLPVEVRAVAEAIGVLADPDVEQIAPSTRQ